MSSRMTSRLLSRRSGVSHNCRLTAKTSAPENPIDCNGANSWAVRNLHQQIAEAGTTVTSDILPTVRGEDDRLFRVFQNLIENGIKYRGERTPEIKLSARARGEFGEISVRDNGIDFDMKHANRFLGMFQRLHGQDKFEGTGIGLATCKKIMEGYGGQVWTESTPGEGSTFYFSVPAADRLADRLVSTEPREG